MSKTQKQIRFPPPPEVPWDVFILALAQAHDRGMSEEQRKARKKRKKKVPPK